MFCELKLQLTDNSYEYCFTETTILLGKKYQLSDFGLGHRFGHPAINWRELSVTTTGLLHKTVGTDDNSLRFQSQSGEAGTMTKARILKLAEVQT